MPSNHRQLDGFSTQVMAHTWIQDCAFCRTQNASSVTFPQQPFRKRLQCRNKQHFWFAYTLGTKQNHSINFSKRISSSKLTPSIIVIVVIIVVRTTCYIGSVVLVLIRRWAVAFHTVHSFTVIAYGASQSQSGARNCSRSHGRDCTNSSVSHWLVGM